jgi:hypothetical protein
VESRPEPQLRAGNDSNFSQGTNRIEPYRSTATHVNPILRRSRRTTSGSASGADMQPDQIEPSRSIGTLNSPFQQNADSSVRSFMHDESWRSSIPSTTLVHTGWPAQRTNTGRPPDLGTPPMPDHAVP